MAAAGRSSGGLERNVLILTVHGAKGLPAADSNGKSDPYCRLIDTKGLIGDGFKTKTVKKTLDPEWNHSVRLEANFKLTRLKFKVFDHDTFSSDDLLGVAYADPSGFYDGHAHDVWLPLSGGLTHKAPGAALHITLQIEWHIPVVVPGTWLRLEQPQIDVGLGWEFSKKTPAIDLDASLAVLRKDDTTIDRAAFDRLSICSGAVVHTGDNRTGEGDGDDELIHVNLSSLPPDAEKLAVVINCYDRKPINTTKSAYLRLLERSTHKTIAFSRLNSIPEAKPGLFFGYFIRHPEGGWWFSVRALPIEGNTVVDSLPHVVAALQGMVPS